MDKLFELNTLLLFLLIFLPGYLFRRFYFQGEFSKQFNAKDLAYTLLMTSIIGIFINVICFFSFKNLVKLIGFDKPVKVIVNSSLRKQIFESFKNLDLETFINNDEIAYTLGAYLLMVCFVSVNFASISWFLIRNFKLDRKYSVFRFDNYWNYYFKGEIRDFKDFNKIPIGKLMYTNIDALTQTASGDTKLISGVLTQYTIKPKTNELSNIYITQASRWKSKINDDTKQKEVYTYNIKGDCLVIPYKTILELNLTYVVEKVERFRNIKRILNFIHLYILPIVTLFFILLLIISEHHYFNSSNGIFANILKKGYLLFVFVTWFSFINTLLDFLLGKITNEKAKKDRIIATSINVLYLLSAYCFATVAREYYFV